MPELKARFVADTKDFDAPVSNMAKRHAAAMSDIRSAVASERARNVAVIAERKKFTETSRRQYFDEIRERNRIAATTGGGFFGRFSRFGVAQSMFTSVARDTAASLASGAPLTQVIGQQAPQVLQAFSMIGISLKLLGVYAIGAGLALLTLKKGAEALEAKRQEKKSESDLAFTEGLNRNKLFPLLEANKKRLKPGEADYAAEMLAQAIANSAADPGTLKWIEGQIRARLKQVILSPEDKKKLDEIAEISTDAMIGSLPAKERAREMIRQKFREDKAELDKLSKGVPKTSGDWAVIQAAYANIAARRDTQLKELDEKDKKAAKAPDANELQRISGMAVGDVVMVDIARAQLRQLETINRNTARGRGVNFGGR